MVDGKRAKELNDSIRYTAWSVFKVARPLGEGDRSERVRSGVVLAVVEGDERERPAARQAHVADEGVGDDLISRGGDERRPVDVGVLLGDSGVLRHVQRRFPS